MYFGGGRGALHVLSGFGEAEPTIPSDRFAELALDAVGHVVAALDANGRVLYWNRAAEALFGWRSEEVLGADAATLLGIDLQQMDADEIDGALRRGVQWSGELSVADRSGRRFPVAVTTSGVFDEGELVAVVAATTDLTGWRRLEAAHRKADRHRRDSFELAAFGVGICGLDGRVLEANAALCEILGRDHAEVIGARPDQLLPGADGLRVAERIAGMLGRGRDVDVDDYRLVRPDGTAAWVAVTAKLIPDDAGEPEYFLVQAVDVTDRKTLSLERKAAAARARAALLSFVESVSSAVELRDPYTAGHQRAVARLSSAIGSALGLEADMVKGIEVAASIHDIGKIGIPSELLNKPGPLSAVEYELVKTHARAGHDIVTGVEFPWPVAATILGHHERMDGSGYPSGLVGDAIPLGSRIIAVADTIEAMSAHRPYRPALGLDAAIDAVRRGIGAQFDRDVADVALRLHETGALVELVNARAQ